VQLFSFRAADHTAQYHEHGWVHIPGGATSGFCASVHAQLARHEDRSAVDRPALSVAKEQYVLDLPEPAALLGELFRAVGTVCGLAPERLTLSERHVNVYADDAAPCPRPHKDRLASQVSVGISVAVPPGSHLVLWPHDDRAPNPLQRPGLTESLVPEEAPETTLAGCEEVTIEDEPGDVMMFAGSTMWHTRRNPAGAVVVYFKCNDFASDPLGEDPETRGAEDSSRHLVATDAELPGAIVSLSRRFESVTREYPLRIGTEWLNVQVAGRTPRRITEREWQLMRAVDGTSSVDALCADAGVDRATVARLVRLGALELSRVGPRESL
jgi:hypothetical protein